MMMMMTMTTTTTTTKTMKMCECALSTVGIQDFNTHYGGGTCCAVCFTASLRSPAHCTADDNFLFLVLRTRRVI